MISCCSDSALILFSASLTLLFVAAAHVHALAPSEEKAGATATFTFPELNNNNDNYSWGSKDRRQLRLPYHHVYNALLTTNNGTQVQVLFNVEPGHLIIDGTTYTFKQMHWHTPSEHRFDAVQYAAELHQVYVAPDGSRAAVAMLYKYGKPDPLLTMLKPELDEICKHATCELEGEETQVQVVIPKFSSKLLRKRSRRYYRYPGSLTTPPYDQNVIWNVLAKVKTISKDQVEALKAPLCGPNKVMNSRPTQPLNGRIVQYYHGN
ncbi:Alpha carbonic anhydrase 1 chloroplastic [Bienertia sinuspersici]